MLSRKLKKSSSVDSIPKKKTKSITVDLKPSMENENKRTVQFFELYSFWTSMAVHAVSPSLLVRLYKPSDENGEIESVDEVRTSNSESGYGPTLFLKKMNNIGSDSVFMVPLPLLKTFYTALCDIWKTIDLHLEEEELDPGLEEISTKQQFTDLSWWDSSSTKKVGNLLIKPYRSQYGINIRVFNHLDSSKYKEYYDENTGDITYWRGPQATLNTPTLVNLIKTLLKILTQEKIMVDIEYTPK